MATQTNRLMDDKKVNKTIIVTCFKLHYLALHMMIKQSCASINVV